MCYATKITFLLSMHRVKVWLRKGEDHSYILLKKTNLWAICTRSMTYTIKRDFSPLFREDVNSTKVIICFIFFEGQKRGLSRKGEEEIAKNGIKLLKILSFISLFDINF